MESWDLFPAYRQTLARGSQPGGVTQVMRLLDLPDSKISLVEGMTIRQAIKNLS